MQLEVRKPIDASRAEIFSAISDIEEWPRTLRSVRAVHVLTPPPLRPGSRFQLVRVMLQHEADHEVKIVALHPPNRLLLSAASADLDYQLDHLVESVFGAGPRLTLIFRSKPRTSLLSSAFYDPVCEHSTERRTRTGPRRFCRSSRAIQLGGILANARQGKNCTHDRAGNLGDSLKKLIVASR